MSCKVETNEEMINELEDEIESSMGQFMNHKLEKMVDALAYRLGSDMGMNKRVIDYEEVNDVFVKILISKISSINIINKLEESHQYWFKTVERIEKEYKSKREEGNDSDDASDYDNDVEE